jgi:hypothetical protein
MRGGGPVQPIETRPIKKRGLGFLVALIGTGVIAVIMVIIVANGGSGSSNSPQSPGISPQSAASPVNPVTGQRIPPKPDNLLVTEEEYQELRETWNSWPHEYGEIGYAFEDAASEAGAQGLSGFRLHGLPREELVEGTKEVWFIRLGDGWVVKKIVP